MSHAMYSHLLNTNNNDSPSDNISIISMIRKNNEFRVTYSDLSMLNFEIDLFSDNIKCQKHRMLSNMLLLKKLKVKLHKNKFVLTLWNRDRRYAVSIPYRTVPGRDGIEKKEVGRDETGRYAVSDSYTALPCRRKKSFNNDFQ
jgi:hypothetical protein